MNRMRSICLSMSTVQCYCTRCEVSGLIAIGSLDHHKWTCARLRYFIYDVTVDIVDDKTELVLSVMGKKVNISREYIDMFMFWYSRIQDGTHRMVDSRLQGDSTTIVLTYNRIQLGDQIVEPYSHFDLGGRGEDNFVYTLGDRCFKSRFVALSLAVNGAQLIY